MAAKDQIKSLIKSFGEGDEDRFFSSALQIAASEARKGHTNAAQELKLYIENARKSRSASNIETGRTISIIQPKKELRDLLQAFNPKIKLKDMVLRDEVSNSLRKLINEQQNWQLLQQYNLKPRRKILLTGPPGTGKTMTAQAIAGELGLPVFIVRLDGLISKYLGESIAKLQAIFDAMVENRGVYLFDEFDSIGSHRNQGQDVGEIKRVLNSFLINIENDESNGVIIAATNIPDSLDQALFRRFDDVISYPLPNEKEILIALKKNLKAFKFSGKKGLSDASKLAIGLNYSDLSKACDNTVKEMLLRGENTLKMDDLIAAVQHKK